MRTLLAQQGSGWILYDELQNALASANAYGMWDALGPLIANGNVELDTSEITMAMLLRESYSRVLFRAALQSAGEEEASNGL